MYPIYVELTAMATITYKLPYTSSRLPLPCLPHLTDKKGLYFGGSLVDTTSYALYITTIAVLIQFVVFVTVGAVADHGSEYFAEEIRSVTLSWFLGCGLIPLFLPSTDIFPFHPNHTHPTSNHQSALQRCRRPPNLFVSSFSSFHSHSVSNSTHSPFLPHSTVCYGASVVFWYAYLPTLVRHHPTVLSARANRTMPPKAIAAVGEHIGNAISGHGFAVSYAGGIVALVIAAAGLFLMGQATSMYNVEKTVCRSPSRSAAYGGASSHSSLCSGQSRGPARRYPLGRIFCFTRGRR
ncbi:hypothetical protein BC938DRAFT_475034, partial [Jimgerdemannia flammicorona]